jgi:uncharacterized protein (TIGR02246 family)
MLAGLAGCMSSQHAAQQQGTQIAMLGQAVPESTNERELRRIASDLNNQRAAYYRKGDLVALTSLYTSDATFVELSPEYQSMKGRDQIRQHMQELMNAKATDIVFNVAQAEMAGNDTITVSGDYYVVRQGGQRASGRFTQLLRQDGGTWKIASHSFARPQPITASEIAACGLGCRTGFFGYH